MPQGNGMMNSEDEMDRPRKRQRIHRRRPISMRRDMLNKFNAKEATKSARTPLSEGGEPADAKGSTATTIRSKWTKGKHRNISTVNIQKKTKKMRESMTIRHRDERLEEQYRSRRKHGISTMIILTRIQESADAYVL
uniref:Uncharacterized protein n=1 Tax=Bursaphelenchus xylophilus TaxID=6326 RepID=A0A1I7RKK3_BURXY